MDGNQHRLFRNPLVALMLCGYLDDRLLSNGAGASLSGIQPLFDREAAAMGFKPLHQQVIDSSKVVVAFVLQRLENGRQQNWSNLWLKFSLYFYDLAVTVVEMD